MRLKRSKEIKSRRKEIIISIELDKKITAYMAEHNVKSESALIKHAVIKYIDGDYSDETLKLNGVKNLHSEINTLRDMLEMTFKFISKMHINLLSYHAEIDPEMRDAAWKSAVFRHNKFLDAFTQGLKNDPPFFEKLLSRFIRETAD